MNIQAMMKQAQALQKDMLKIKKEIDDTEFVGESSLVKVTVNGKKEVLNIQIDKSNSMDAEDIEMLEDMLMIAFNNAMEKVNQLTEQKMGKFGNMSGMF